MPPDDPVKGARQMEGTHIGDQPFHDSHGAAIEHDQRAVDVAAADVGVAIDPRSVPAIVIALTTEQAGNIDHMVVK